MPLWVLVLACCALARARHDIPIPRRAANEYMPHYRRPHEPRAAFRLPPDEETRTLNMQLYRIRHAESTWAVAGRVRAANLKTSHLWPSSSSSFLHPHVEDLDESTSHSPLANTSVSKDCDALGLEIYPPGLSAANCTSNAHVAAQCDALYRLYLSAGVWVL